MSTIMDDPQAMASTRRGIQHWLSLLNPSQLNAVTASSETPLQILAGPGSGKTRVLTCRIAHLIQHDQFKPHQITAVTFTNKAANEMKKRLQALLGHNEADQLVLGTFHATCARYLRRYGKRINLDNNFAIADADDCKKIMTSILKNKSDALSSSRISLKEAAVLSEISKAKVRQESPDGMAIRAAQEPGGSSSSTNTLAVIAELYADYEIALREANSLDFDDLLVYGLKLFRLNPQVLESCFHILVDEFQDTNTTQYELMKCFAKAHGGVTVVGDPDQSIYGWRAAEVENLDKMTKDFPGVQTIFLEENYRSTGSILAASHSIVSQDKNRIAKRLYTSHPKSTTVTLKAFSNPVIEASFISTEIKRMVAYSGGVFKYDDFAILLRYNALSRNIESALQKDGIPSRVIGGHKFFERMEIKDLLAYLQLADNPNFTPAYLRVVNVPRRAIGEKSISDIFIAARAAKVSPMELSERIIDGDRLPPGIKPAMKKNLASFVGVIRKLRRAARRGQSVADLIRLVLEKTRYEEYLRVSQQDFDQRWENVQELINYSVTVEAEQERQQETAQRDLTFITAKDPSSGIKIEVKTQRPLHHIFRKQSNTSSTSESSNRSTSAPARNYSVGTRVKEMPGENDEVVEMLSSDEDDLDEAFERVPAGKVGKAEVEAGEFDGEEIEESLSLTPLRYFLQTSMLSTDTESQEEQENVPRVTISTVHAAKGLEWPVIFIPAVEQGTFPSYRCTEPHEIAEERRLLYVAMTRAQVFLSLSFCQSRMMGGEDSEKELSEFAAASLESSPDLFSFNLPDINESVRNHICTILDRPRPDETATKDMIMKHVRAAPPLSMWDPPLSRGSGGWGGGGGGYNRFARKEITKAARAAEYWASEVDEYDLPNDRGENPSTRSGFSSAKTMTTNNQNHQQNYKNYSGISFSPVNKFKPIPKPAPAPIKSSNRDLPGPLPFSFGGSKSTGDGEGEGKQMDLGALTTSSNSSLAAMKSLGLGLGGPGNGSGTGIGIGSRTIDGGGGGVGGRSQFGGIGTSSNSSRVGSDGLARGTKRLGMGRPAPWGTKKARET